MPVYLIVAVFGLLIGSFLNVCIYRLPMGLSIVSPPSRCPSCGNPVKAVDNIPVLSWILLLGSCRWCGSPISPRYPAIEALNSLLYVLIFHQYGLGLHSYAYMLFASALVVASFIDFDHQIIPDEISLGCIPIGIALGWLVLKDPFSRSLPLGWQASLIGAIAGFLLFASIAIGSKLLFGREGMGAGDVKLMGAIGAFTGWKGVLLTTLAGSFAGSVVGLLLIVFKGKGRLTKIPFGPYLALGALVTIISGREILDMYIHGRF